MLFSSLLSTSVSRITKVLNEEEAAEGTKKWQQLCFAYRISMLFKADYMNAIMDYFPLRGKQ